MESEGLRKLELFTENTEKLRKEFFWQSAMLKRLAAFLYTAEDKKADPALIRDNLVMIKKNTGWFSSFKGNAALIVATMFSLSDDPYKLMKSTLDVYEMLKQVKFRASDYLAVAACQIASSTSTDRFAATVERAKTFYDGMKSDHRFLTGQDDYIFAALLGLSDIEVTSGLDRMEQLFQSLRPKLRSHTGVQTLTQVLVLSKNPSDSESRVLDLFNGFKQQGLKLDKSYALSSLGVLALLPADTRSILQQVVKTSEQLRSRKGFGLWSSVSKQELSLLSASLVTLDTIDHSERSVLDATLSTSMINIIIAQQTAAAAAAAAAASSSAASSSSG